MHLLRTPRLGEVSGKVPRRTIQSEQLRAAIGETRLLAAALVLGLALTFGASTATAQDAPATQGASVSEGEREARAAFRRGREAFEAGRYEDALTEFRRSHVISGRFALLYNIGQAEIRLERPALALEAFEAFLQLAPVDHESRPEVEARVVTLRRTLGEGETNGSSLELPPEDAPARRSPLVAPGVVMLATGVASMVAGAVLGGITLSRDRSLSEECGGDGRCDPARVRPIDRLALATDVTLFAGLGVALVGAVLLALGVTRRGDGERARWRVAPAFGRASGGLLERAF